MILRHGGDGGYKERQKERKEDRKGMKHPPTLKRNTWYAVLHRIASDYDNSSSGSRIRQISISGYDTEAVSG